MPVVGNENPVAVKILKFALLDGQLLPHHAVENFKIERILLEVEIPSDPHEILGAFTLLYDIPLCPFSYSFSLGSVLL